MRGVEFNSMVELLRLHAVEAGGDEAVAILEDGSSNIQLSWTYEQLDFHARAVAGTLQERLEPGSRVLLLFPFGVGFITGFMACLYAGMVAVPAYPPRSPRHIPRLEAIVHDSGATTILTESGIADPLRLWIAGSGRDVTLICVDDSPLDAAEAWVRPLLTSDTPAFLQYTSGSTGTPRGVIVTHGNLLANHRMIHHSAETCDQILAVSWLPFYHDMGLIGAMLHPLYRGGRAYLMSPLSFLQQPYLWLKAMSEHRGQALIAPNFALDIAVKRVSLEQRATLDLSSVQVAFCGSEPIDNAVLQRFVAYFSPAGFNPQALFPCYGLAEATLLTTGCKHKPRPMVLEANADELAAGRVIRATTNASHRTLVSCGQSTREQDLHIVDPETRKTLPDCLVGEIWLRGPHVSPGYWNQPELTAETFRAERYEAPGIQYLRTGDLGFTLDGEVFITGRLKDVIIIRGRNHYPQDLERVVMASHPLIEPHACAAFALNGADSEGVGLVCEVKQEKLTSEEASAIASAIRTAVFHEHELALQTIALLPPRRILKTSSGKVQRRACRTALEAGTFPILYRWDAPTDSPEPILRPTPSSVELTASVAGPASEVAAKVDSSPAPEALASAQRADRVIGWLREYAERRIDSRLMDERRSIPPHIVLDFGNQGLLGLEAPLEVGGLALTYRDQFRVYEQMAAVDFTLGSFLGVHNALGLRPLLRNASERQRRESIPLIAQGRSLASFAFTEPAAGSNPLGIEARAVPDGKGGWRLRGSKKWIGTAAWAGFITVFVKLEDERGTEQGITAFLLPDGRQGLRHGREELTMGVRAMVQNTVHLDNVPVTTDDLLGRAGEGMPIAHEIMKFARLCIGAGSLGGMKRCVQLMLRYASARTISTGRLLDNYLSRERISQLMTRIEALEAFIQQFATWLDAGLDVPEEFYAAVKVIGPESLGLGVDWLMQLLGGRGYIETNLVPQMYRDSRLVRIFEGPTETMQTFLGTRLAYHEGPLQAFLARQPGAGPIAARLKEVAGALRQVIAQESPQSPSLSQQQLSALLGDVGTWGLWLLMVTLQRQTRGGTRLEEAQTWLEEQFSDAVSRAMRPGRSRRLRTSDAILQAAAAYTHSIGDLDNSRPGEEHELDPLLRRRAPESSPQAQPGSTLAAPEDGARREAPALQRPDVRETRPALNALTIEGLMLDWLATRLKVPRHTLDPLSSFADLGLDSLSAVELAQLVKERVGVAIPATASWNHPTVRALSSYVAGISAGAGKSSEKVASEPASPASFSAPYSTPSPAPALTVAAIPQSGEADSTAELARLLAAELASLRD